MIATAAVVCRKETTDDEEETDRSMCIGLDMLLTSGHLIEFQLLAGSSYQALASHTTAPSTTRLFTCRSRYIMESSLVIFHLDFS